MSLTSSSGYSSIYLESNSLIVSISNLPPKILPEKSYILSASDTSESLLSIVAASEYLLSLL